MNQNPQGSGTKGERVKKQKEAKVMTKLGAFRKWVNSGNQPTFMEDVKAFPKEFGLICLGLLIGGAVLVMVCLAPRIFIPALIALWLIEIGLKKAGYDVWKD